MNKSVPVKNVDLFRLISKILPLKRKLNFLIRTHLKRNLAITIPYFNNWDIYITVNDSNRSTVEKLILEGINGQPEITLIRTLRDRLPDNMILIDVGGNIGTFLSLFLDKCEKVIVFEPMRQL